MNINNCPDCESEIYLCPTHQQVEMSIDEKYNRGSLEWYEAMKVARLA